MTKEYLLNLKAYVINMPDQEEKYIECRTVLQDHGFTDVHRLISYDAGNKELLNNLSKNFGIKTFQGSPQQLSLTLAHMTALQELVNSEKEELLIFEDDIIFHTLFNVLLEDKIKDLPEYGVLYLGCLIPHNEDCKSKFIVKNGGIFHAHAYSIKRQAAKLILDTCKKKERGVIIDVMYYGWFKDTCTDLVALIQSPHTSENKKEMRINREDITGLIYQKKHISSVPQNNELIVNNWR